MSRPESMALKLALWLLIAEGWTTSQEAARRLKCEGSELDAAEALLHRWGLIERGGGGLLRWTGLLGFEELWEKLSPGVPCPVRGLA